MCGAEEGAKDRVGLEVARTMERMQAKMQRWGVKRKGKGSERGGRKTGSRDSFRQLYEEGAL